MRFRNQQRNYAHAQTTFTTQSVPTAPEERDLFFARERVSSSLMFPPFQYAPKLVSLSLFLSGIISVRSLSLCLKNFPTTRAAKKLLMARYV